MPTALLSATSWDASLDGDFILACIAHSLKEEKRLTGNTVVVTVMANLGLMKALASWQVQTLATPVGDRYVSDMLEEPRLRDRRRAVRAYYFSRTSAHWRRTADRPSGAEHASKAQAASLLGVFAFHPLSSGAAECARQRERSRLRIAPPSSGKIENARKELAEQGRVVVHVTPGRNRLLRIMMEGPNESRV